MQTILGSTGVIGKNIAAALPAYTNHIRLVSRNPQKVNPSDELVSADLLNEQQVKDAVKGSEVVYLTAGLPYITKTWERDWPLVMQNVLNACKENGSRFVFFDNVYCYGKVNGWMTEESPVHPTSAKGVVRARLLQMIWNEVSRDQVQALVARAADFYGPDTANSFANVMVFDNLKKGKKAQWLLNADVKHSFTYTPDAGKATALLGNTTSAYNQSWHLPGDPNTLTGREFISQAEAALGTNKGVMVLPKWMVRMVGLFVPVIKESIEMLYQNDSDYLFDSSKFRKAFPDFPVTTYQEGIIATAQSMK